jgi:hypothetical protein
LFLKFNGATAKHTTCKNSSRILPWHKKHCTTGTHAGNVCASLLSSAAQGLTAEFETRHQQTSLDSTAVAGSRIKLNAKRKTSSADDNPALFKTWLPSELKMLLVKNTRTQELEKAA